MIFLAINFEAGKQKLSPLCKNRNFSFKICIITIRIKYNLPELFSMALDRIIHLCQNK